MAEKMCGSCIDYGKIEIVPGSKALGCSVTITRLDAKQVACKDHRPKKPSS